MAAAGAGLALDTGGGGDDMRLWLSVQKAMRKQTSDPGQCRPIYERTHASCALIHTRASSFEPWSLISLGTSTPAHEVIGPVAQHPIPKGSGHS